MFGHRFLVHSCDVFLDVFGVEEASDGEPSDAGIVDVQEERLGECSRVSLGCYSGLYGAASGIDCQERAAGNGAHPREGPVVDRQEALQIQSVELCKRSYALRFYLRSKSRDGVENADDDFVCKNEKGLLQQLRGQAHLRPEVEADRLSFRILEVGAIEQLGDPFRERDLAFLVVDLNVLEQRRGRKLFQHGQNGARDAGSLAGLLVRPVYVADKVEQPIERTDGDLLGDVLPYKGVFGEQQLDEVAVRVGAVARARKLAEDGEEEAENGRMV